MALSPLAPPEDRAVEVTPVIETSRTYALDFDTGEIGGIIDGLNAIRQFIRKALATARFHFLIYGADYGSELDDLIGQDVPFELLKAEIPRIITDALIYDTRIDDVTDFVLTRISDKLYVTFTVNTFEGVITEGVTV